MNRTLVIIGVVIVALWITFRVGGFLWRSLRPSRKVPAARHACPKCGSRRLDDMSDAASGYCLSCKHIWGVKRPSGDSRGK